MKDRAGVRVSREAVSNSRASMTWSIIPSDHKWFAMWSSQIIVQTMEGFGIELPKPKVSIADIRKVSPRGPREESGQHD